MMAWMTAEAVSRTLQSGRVTYWSRSRQAFWVKGESSGHVQDLVEMRVDCDRDCLLVLVRQTGPACHTNRRSCFLHRAARRRRGRDHGADGRPKLTRISAGVAPSARRVESARASSRLARRLPPSSRIRS